MVQLQKQATATVTPAPVDPVKPETSEAWKSAQPEEPANQLNQLSLLNQLNLKTGGDEDPQQTVCSSWRKQLKQNYQIRGQQMSLRFSMRGS